MRGAPLAGLTRQPVFFLAKASCEERGTRGSIPRATKEASIRLMRMRARLEPRRTQDQNRPTIFPSVPTSIESAAGTRGKPGMVMISPQIATTNSAPAESLTSRTGMV